MTLEELLAEQYGVSGELKRLDGDIDENWALIDGAKKFFVKVSRGDARIALRHTAAILSYVKKSQHEVPVETIHRSRTGELVCDSLLGNEKVSVRLTDFMPGQPLSAKARPDAREIRSLGRALGQLDTVLSNLKLSEALSTHPWQLEALSTPRNLQALPLPEPLREHLGRYLTDRWPATQGALKRLPQQIIHNDCDGDNVLIDAGEVSGVLDFGDASYGPKVIDIAVTAAYVSARWCDSRLAKACIDGYRSRASMGQLELSLLGDVVLARNALRALNAAEGAKQDPENSEYRLRNIKDAAQAFLHHDREMWKGMIA